MSREETATTSPKGRPMKRLAWLLVALMVTLTVRLTLPWGGELGAPGLDLEARSRALRAEPLPGPFATLVDLHTLRGPTRPGDWLAEHTERGQSYAEFALDEPRLAAHPPPRLVIQLLGALTSAQRGILDDVRDVVAASFCLPVETRAPLALDTLPKRAWRDLAERGQRQYHTRFLLDELLAPRREPGVAALIGLTAVDLYPNPRWSFVFGSASLTERIGVWSIHRFGDPASGIDAYQLCLRRAAKVAVHELGHIFGLRHCIAYTCVMNGSNSLAETDRGVLRACPLCLRKLSETIGFDPHARFASLERAYRSKGLERERRFVEASLARLGPAPDRDGREPR